MAVGLAPSRDILPPIDRLVGTFGGIALVTLFQILFSPLVRRSILAFAQPSAGSSALRQAKISGGFVDRPDG
jgi:hypothetical protein